MPGVDAGSQERGGSLAGGSDCRAPIVTSRMVRTTVQLPEDQAAALTRAARRRGVSKAAIVREALSVCWSARADFAREGFELLPSR
jgi:hypothetical protein